MPRMAVSRASPISSRDWWAARTMSVPGMWTAAVTARLMNTEIAPRATTVTEPCNMKLSAPQPVPVVAPSARNGRISGHRLAPSHSSTSARAAIRATTLRPNQTMTAAMVWKKAVTMLDGDRREAPAPSATTLAAVSSASWNRSAGPPYAPPAISPTAACEPATTSPVKVGQTASAQVVPAQSRQVRTTGAM